MNIGHHITFNSKVKILRMSRNSPGQRIDVFLIIGDSISRFIYEALTLTAKI